MEGEMVKDSGESKTWIWVVVVLAVLGLVGYLIWSKKKAKDTTTTDPKTPKTETPTAPTIEKTNASASTGTSHKKTSSAVGSTGSEALQIGSKGDNVKKLQEYLVSKGANITADGIFGPKTKAAVLAAGIPYPVTSTAYKSLWDVYSDAVITEAKDVGGGLSKIVDGVEQTLASPFKGAAKVGSYILDQITHLGN